MKLLRYLRPRFALRTVLGAMTLLAFFLAYHIHWIDQRRLQIDLFERYEWQQAHRRKAELFCWHEHYTNQPAHTSNASSRLPLMLRILGEKAQPFIIIDWNDEATWLSETRRLRDLFPEAVVMLKLQTISP